MITHPAGKAEKLFYIERTDEAYDDVSSIPEEYLQLILPYAGVYFEKDEYCEILSQHKQVGPFSFWLQEVFANEAFILCPYTPMHIWALHFMYDTSLQVELYEDKSFNLEERECNLFNLESDLHKVPMVSGQRLLSCHVNFLPNVLKNLARLHPGLSRLAKLESNGISGPLNKYPYHINAVCSYLLQRAISCRHIGIPAEHFIYRCCLDLLLNFAQQDLQLPIEVDNVLHLDVLTQLFNLLLEHPYQSFTNSQLASMFDLPIGELMGSFLKHYSISLNGFIRMTKMIMVFELLTEKSTPLSTIANAAGYTNWQTLNREFKMYYGCELDELRRAM
ncbi:helix-turn-helix domain-containing protein [Chitinophaga sancti]|uniref:AraC family transcriptional regulator n=1 Tax=Chitinophaga sancti TaxID=1004 RepID=A0A1K1S2I8_9BACT|nr:AraC family transcriptional regulator [Chitinophaga sancti]WQD59640.1 AraC family transcriptional regulator [Chitinophaga sancti]WQG88229.1 AraC family transcriptional regulator [Chitinophaga sancti]SFW78537.1 AraC-type DNA-binding protein [Chitinophaga sancti]